MIVADIRNVSKKFGTCQAVKNVSFSIRKEEIVGLIGPNGSGKTTLLNTMMTMIKPDVGEIEISGTIGMAVSRKGFFSHMSTRNNIKIFAMMLGVSEQETSAIFNDLQIDFESVKFSRLSAGMKQKVSLAFSLLEKCDLLLLDEPINHLDFDAILGLRKILIRKR